MGWGEPALYVLTRRQYNALAIALKMFEYYVTILAQRLAQEHGGDPSRIVLTFQLEDGTFQVSVQDIVEMRLRLQDLQQANLPKLPCAN